MEQVPHLPSSIAHPFISRRAKVMEPPLWSEQIRTAYLSGAANQFLLHGNVHDRLLLPGDGDADNESPEMGGLVDYLARVQLRKFDLVLSYELGPGMRIETGREFLEHLRFSEDPPAADPPRFVAWLDHFLRYCVNLRNLSPEELATDRPPEQAPPLAGRNHHIAIVLKSAELLFPDSSRTRDYQLSSMAAVVRNWSRETHFIEQNLAVFLLAENLHDLHPLLANNTRAVRVELPVPGASELESALPFLSRTYPAALENFSSDHARVAARLAGTTLGSLESLLKTREYEKRPLVEDDLADLKKSLVEKDSQGLIEFLEPTRNLDDVIGHDAIVEWMRQDIALWRQGDLQALPMGYLLCGPVGTGKTYLVECLAGEAGIPVVKMKNFRDRWVGSTEGNLEKIFHLLHALGRCIVFVDEADQALGRREAGSGDSGVSGRVYSMMAKEMSDSRNRGRILWILASSRPDLIEVDLKRPGRVDIKIPLFPSRERAETYRLVRALCRQRGLDLPADCPRRIAPLLPDLVTPGAAESLAVKVHRFVKTRGIAPVEALRDCLDEYQDPVPEEIMRFQIGLAAQEASDLAFVPEEFRV